MRRLQHSLFCVLEEWSCRPEQHYPTSFRCFPLFCTFPQTSKKTSHLGHFCWKPDEMRNLKHFCWKKQCKILGLEIVARVGGITRVTSTFLNFSSDIEKKSVWGEFFLWKHGIFVPQIVNFSIFTEFLAWRVLRRQKSARFPGDAFFFSKKYDRIVLSCLFEYFFLAEILCVLLSPPPLSPWRTFLLK